MSEELEFGMGLNTTAFARGMRSAKEIAVETGAQIKESISEFGKSMLAPFAAIASVEGAKKILEFGESIERGAEIAGTSTDFFQTLGAAMRQTGGDADKGAKGLERLTALMGQAREGNEAAIKTFQNLGISLSDANGNARDTESVLRQVSDMVHNAKDANEAAAIAVDIFGKKLGLELVPALKAGSAGLDAFGKSASKLSEEDLKAITGLKRELDSAGNTALVFGGKAVSAFAKLSQALGTLSGGGFRGFFAKYLYGEGDEIEKKMDAIVVKVQKSKELIDAQKGLQKAQDASKDTTEDTKLVHLMQERDEIAKSLEDKSLSEVERLKAQTELQIKNNEIFDQKKKMADEFHKKEKEAADFAKEQRNLQRQINDAEISEQDAIDAKVQSRDAKTKLTLAELASSKFRFSGALGDDQRTARKIQTLESQREWNRQHGFYDAANDRENQIEALKKTLSGNTQFNDRQDVDRKNNEAITKSSEHLGDLVALAKDKGLAVTVKEIQLSP